MGFEKILVAIDFSDESITALQRADALASAFGCELHVLHVIPSLVYRGVAYIEPLSPDAHEREHVPGAINVPLNDLPDHVPFLPEDKDTPVLSICERGNLSLTGVLFLQSLGYRNARSVDGGTQQWAAEGFATTSSSAPSYSTSA